MERRASERFPSNLKTRMFYGNLFYTGTVIDLSEKGLYIRTKINFQINSIFAMVLLINNQTVTLLGRVKRMVRSSGHESHLESGMGIELFTPPVSYLEFIRNQKLMNDSIN